MMTTTPRAPLALALLSGAAALSHELLWTRRLIDLLGATGEATSRVFGCFFLGLAIGAVIAARLLPKINSLWKAIALSEVAIASLSLPALTLPWWSDWVWPALGPELLVGWQGAAVKTLLSIAVVLLPAVPMGMTLPLFAAACLRDDGSLSRQGVLLYGINTLGGVIGLLVTSLFLLTALGVVGSMAAAAVVNLAIAVAALLLHRAGHGRVDPSASKEPVRRGSKRRQKENRSGAEAPLGNRPATLLAFVSGVAMLSLEVLAIRLLGLVVPSSLQATVAVLVSVILLLAVAAIAFPLMLRLHPSSRKWLLLSLTGAAVASSLTPWLLYRGSDELSQVTMPGGVQPTSATEFTLAVCALALGTIGPAILLGGMVLPAVFGWVGSEGGDRRGESLGYLLAANGVGGILGAEMTDLVVLPRLGIYTGFAAVGCLYGGVALLVLKPWAGRSASRWVAAAVILLLPIGLWSAFSAGVPYLSPRVAEAYDYDKDDTRFGRDGVLLIVDHGKKGRGILVNNQYLLGDTGFARDERREVLLPMLLHPKPERVGCIGVATGISAGAALDYPTPCELTAVELSATVAEAAAEHFGEFNRDLANHPSARLLVEDGRTYIAASEDLFDVIVGDLYRPYGAGEGRLYSVEHFHATRRALRSGGLFCQWLPMYQLTEEHFAVIVASFLQAYPDGELIRANHNAENPILGLVGSESGALNLTDLASRAVALQSAGRVTDAELLSPSKLRRFYLGRLDPDRFIGGPLNTLDNALVELLAGERRVTQHAGGRTPSGQAPYLKGQAWQRFERSLPKLLVD